MKSIGEIMRGREPTIEERATLNHVVEIAEAWQAGEVDIRSAAQLCSQHDRFQAIRFADLGSPQKHTLRAFVDAILATRKDIFDSPHGIIGMNEVYDGGAKAVTNWEGKRVFVWPMFGMDGVSTYPRVDLPPGEERRHIEEAALLGYRDYRKKKRAERGERWER